MSTTILQRLRDSEESYLNSSFWEVQPLFLMVRSGDTAGLKESLHLKLERFPAGRITRDERKQLEYLTVSLVNTFMIAAIEGGVYPPEANAAADHALRRLSQTKDAAEIPALVNEVALALCEMTRRSREQDSGNSHVEKAKHYLADHLTREIRVADVAGAVGLSPAHLSRLFREKTGQTMGRYLIRERIRAAERLLVTGDLTIPEIASLLCFCDQSHFTMMFRRETGLTPGRYREENRR